MEAFFTGFWTTIGAIAALVGTLLVSAVINGILGD